MSLLQNAFYYYVFWCKEKYAIKKWFNHKRYIFLMHFQFNLFISFPFYFSSIMLQLRTQQSLTTQFSRKLDHRRSAFSCYNQVLKTLSEKKMWVRTVFLKTLPQYYVISKETICLFLFCFWCHEMGTVRWTFKQFGFLALLMHSLKSCGMHVTPSMNLEDRPSFEWTKQSAAAAAAAELENRPLTACISPGFAQLGG